MKGPGFCFCSFNNTHLKLKFQHVALWGPHNDAPNTAYWQCISVWVSSVSFKTLLRKLNEIQFRFNTQDNICCLQEWLLILTTAQQELSLLSPTVLERRSGDEVSEQFGNSPELITWTDSRLFLQLWYQNDNEFDDKFCDGWGSNKYELLLTLSIVPNISFISKQIY